MGIGLRAGGRQLGIVEISSPSPTVDGLGFLNIDIDLENPRKGLLRPEVRLAGVKTPRNRSR